MRLGAAQLLVLEMPPHAAVSTAVDLCHAARQGGHARLVNAVLRRLDREGRTWWADQDGPRLNTPDWLWESWLSGLWRDRRAPSPPRTAIRRRWT